MLKNKSLTYVLSIWEETLFSYSMLFLYRVLLLQVFTESLLWFLIR